MMRISKKLLFAIDAVIDIAHHGMEGPVQIGDIAERQGIPRRYLEQVLQHLVRSGILMGRRGPRGGYRLARPANKIEMLEVVQALEGAIAPMECFQLTPEGKVSCSHETDGDHACATKLLWTKVQGGVTKALSGTTLAELVEFAEQHSEKPAVPATA